MIGKLWTVRRTVCWLSLAFAWLLLFSQSPAAQAEVYRWEDDAGDTHYADSFHAVPEAYRGGAEEITDALSAPISLLPSLNDANQEEAQDGNEFDSSLGGEGGEAEPGQEEEAPEFDFTFPKDEGGQPDFKAIFDKAVGDVSGVKLVGMVLGMLLSFAILFFVMVLISGVILKWACAIVGEGVGLGRAMLVSFLQGLAAFFAGIGFGFVGAIVMSEPTVGQALGLQALSLIAGLLIDALVIRLMICQSYLKSLAITLLRLILIFVLTIALVLFAGFFSFIL